MEGLSESVKGLIMNDDLEKTPEERINIFFQFVKVSQFYSIWLCQLAVSCSFCSFTCNLKTLRMLLQLHVILRLPFCCFLILGSSFYTRGLMEECL